MANDKQLFAPVPLRAMYFELSGLQLRVLICVAAHDRMSLVTGKGQGCRASNDRMKSMISCSYARLCSTLTELVDLGLLARERLGRHTVYRVIYSDEDRLLFSNVSHRPIGCQSASDEGSIGCHDLPESGGKLPETASQYIPLNGGIYSVETGEYNSSEDAHLAARHDFSGTSWKAGSEESRLKAGLSRTEYEDNPGGQMARLERALSAGEVVNNLDWYRRLEDFADADDPAQSGRAMRLRERLIETMSDAEHSEWCAENGWVDEFGEWHPPQSQQAA